MSQRTVNKSFRRFLFCVYVFSACCGLAETEIVDGLTWTYTFSDGRATVGDGRCAAITPMTVGVVVVPKQIGGCPVVGIADQAFNLCFTLTSVKIPESVTKIGKHAFWGCKGIESIVVPSKVSQIGENAFGSCDGLCVISVAEGNTAYCSIDGVLYNKAKTELLRCPCKMPGVMQIPGSVKIISEDSFHYCENLNAVTIPDGVVSIGISAFENCSGLKTLTIPSSVEEIGDFAFAGCGGIESLTMSNRIKNIGKGAFQQCPLLKKVRVGKQDEIVEAKRILSSAGLNVDHVVFEALQESAVKTNIGRKSEEVAVADLFVSQFESQDELGEAKDFRSLFGIEFGGVVPDSIKPSFISDEGCPVYKFTPKAPFRKFKNYNFVASPTSRKIFEINAYALAYDLERSIQAEQKIVMSLLEEKYGHKDIHDNLNQYLRQVEEDASDHGLMFFGPSHFGGKKKVRRFIKVFLGEANWFGCKAVGIKAIDYKIREAAMMELKNKSKGDLDAL